MMIKNVIFDLGGILIDIFPQQAVDAFKLLGFKDDEKALLYFKENQIFEKIEIIQNSYNLLCNEINLQLKHPVSDDKIISAWNKLLGSYKSENVNFALKCKSKYRTFLLSNTNRIHYEDYTETFKSQFGYMLHDLFEKSYFSHQIGMRKPNAEIFEFVLQDAGLNAEETLFIDDSVENRLAAQKLGIQTVNIKTNQSLLDLPDIQNVIAE